jgi:phage-related baseplate assembly protein
MGNDVSNLPVFQSLPSLSFAVKDPVLVLSNLIANYETFFFNRTGQQITLAEADPRRLLIEVFAYAIAQQRQLIDFANKQNLLPFSSYPYLDAKGTQWGPNKGPRRPAASALAPFMFTLSVASQTAISVPQGTQIAGGNGIVFATTQDATIPIGSTSVTVTGACTSSGSIGNGYLAGQINAIVNWQIPQVITAANTETTAGGSEAETDDQLRYRQFLIPDSFGSAGSIGQYLEAIYGASPAILDAAVIGPQLNTGAPSGFPAGQVQIYVLEQGPSMPNSATLDQVQAACSDDWTRPATDYVFTYAPSGYGYNVSVTWAADVDEAASIANIQAGVNNAVNSYNVWQQSKIGRALNPAYLSQLVMEAGASSCTVASPVHTLMKPWQVPVLNPGSGALVITYVGLENDLVW